MRGSTKKISHKKQL